jgi:hypothetical protein
MAARIIDWRGHDSEGNSVAGSLTVNVGVAQRTPQAAAHVPGRIWLGVDVNEQSVNNDWPHAMALIAGHTWNWSGDQARNLPATAPQATVFSRRYFNGGGWATVTNVRGMLADADQKGIQFPVLSFKIPGNNWAGMAAGNYDSGLAAIAQVALERADAGHFPFAVVFHHEPNGDGQGVDWVAMNRRAIWYLGGRRGGTATSTYVAANDVTGEAINACSVHLIYNAFIFDGQAPSGGTFAQWTNPALMADLNENRGIWGWDAYDTFNNAHRTSDRMQAMFDFGEAHGANCYGIGEWGCYDATDMAACWEIQKRNAAKLVYSDYWNSGANSDADWRIVPNGYPADPAFGITGVGNATTQARLNFYRNTMLPESLTILG